MSTPITVKVERTLDRDFVSNVLITAFDGQYGGCWYWASPAGRFTVESEDHLWTDVHIKPDEETGKPLVDNAPFLTVNAETIRVGIQRILDGDPMIRSDLHNQVLRSVLDGDADIDADAADCIVQIGLMGELIFS